jgi:hypothetical protein
MKDIRGEYRKLIDLERELIHKLEIVRERMKLYQTGEHIKSKRVYAKPYKLK